MISKALDYALRSIVYMASQPDREYFGVKEIAERTSVSRTYLGKILQGLVKEGYLRSTTGPGGGFALAVPPAKLTLKELMECVDGDRVETSCILGLADCSDTNPCPIHGTWKKARRELLADLKRTTVAQAMKKSWPEYRAPKDR